MKIKSVAANDIAQMLIIENENFLEPWNYQTLYYESQLNKNTKFLGIYNEFNMIVGYIGFWIMIDYIDIINIAIARDYQRLGLASKLLQETEEIAIYLGINKISLEVNVNNEKAIQLYKKHGYKKIRRIKNYYDKLKEDAFLMQKEVFNE